MSRNRQNRAEPHAPARSGSGGFSVSHLVFFVSGILLSALAALVVHVVGRASVGSSSSDAMPRVSAAAPWGELQEVPITLERPDDSFPDSSLPVPPTTWFFGAHTEQQVRDRLTAPDVPADQQHLLLSATRWTAVSNGWLLHPPVEVVRALSPEARKRIYDVLRRYPENPLHGNPVHVPRQEFDRWLDESGLPDDKKALFRSLTWVEGETVYFADFEIIESQCTLAERRRLAKAVAQSPGLLLNLRIRPDTDVGALLRYWGRGERGRAMGPFLDSLKHVPGGTSISVSFLFPPFARMRLFTYPDPKTDRMAAREDCLWTSMNFFNDTPDDRFFDVEFIKHTLDIRYVPVATNWVFGDVLMLVDGAGETLHMCVYIADGVVFTKNGLDPIEPWRLMKLADTFRLYPSDNGVRLTGFRRKDLGS